MKFSSFLLGLASTVLFLGCDSSVNQSGSEVKANPSLRYFNDCTVPNLGLTISIMDFDYRSMTNRLQIDLGCVFNGKDCMAKEFGPNKFNISYVNKNDGKGTIAIVELDKQFVDDQYMLRITGNAIRGGKKYPINCTSGRG